MARMLYAEAHPVAHRALRRTDAHVSLRHPEQSELEGERRAALRDLAQRGLPIADLVVLEVQRCQHAVDTQSFADRLRAFDAELLVKREVEVCQHAIDAQRLADRLSTPSPPILFQERFSSVSALR